MGVMIAATVGIVAANTVRVKKRNEFKKGKIYEIVGGVKEEVRKKKKMIKIARRVKKPVNTDTLKQDIVLTIVTGVALSLLFFWWANEVHKREVGKIYERSK